MEGEDSRKAHGQRMRKFKDAFHVSIKYALRPLEPEEFVLHFPEGSLKQADLEALYEGYISCLHQTRVFIDRDFDTLCQETNIEEKLQNLDVMCVEQGIFDGTETSQPGAAAPTKIARRMQLETKQAEIQHLKAILENIQNQQNDLQQQLGDKRKAARALLEAAEPVQTQLKPAEDAAKSWANRGTAEAVAMVQ